MSAKVANSSSFKIGLDADLVQVGLVQLRERRNLGRVRQVVIQDVDLERSDARAGQQRLGLVEIERVEGVLGRLGGARLRRPRQVLARTHQVDP